MVLGILAAAFVVAAALVLVRLHLLATGLSPMTDAVSDYGTTRYHAHYRVMVVLFGLGAALLAVALARDTDAGRLAWLWLYAARRIGIAGFMTDRDRSVITTEGRIHWLLAVAAFTAIALAGWDITWTGAPGALHGVGRAVAATAVATLVTRNGVALQRFFGAAERALYATTIAWLLIAAVDVAINH